MAEKTGTDAAQGAAEEQAQSATDTSAQGAKDETQGVTSDQEAASVEGLRSKVQELLAEKKALQAKVQEREEAEKQKAEGEQSEVEKLTGKVTALEQSLAERDQRAREQSLRLASVTEAQRLGFRNPDIAYRLIDQSKVEFDDGGNAKNIGSLLQDIAKSDAYLIAATDFGGGVRGTSAAKNNDDMNARIRAATGR